MKTLIATISALALVSTSAFGQDRGTTNEQFDELVADLIANTNLNRDALTGGAIRAVGEEVGGDFVVTGTVPDPDPALDGVRQISVIRAGDEVPQGFIPVSAALENSRIDVNEAGVASNTASSALNTAGVASNADGVASNTASSALNTAGVASNADGVASNTASSALNTTGVARNAAGVASNTAGVARNTLSSALNTASIANNSASIAAVNRSSERRDAAILALSGGVDIAEGHTFGLDLGFGFVEGAEAVGLNAGFQVPLETIHWNVQGGLATSFSGDDTVGRVSTGISW